jgi:hypothetical protein
LNVFSATESNWKRFALSCLMYGMSVTTKTAAFFLWLIKNPH